MAFLFPREIIKSIKQKMILIAQLSETPGGKPARPANSQGPPHPQSILLPLSEMGLSI